MLIRTIAAFLVIVGSGVAQAAQQPSDSPQSPSPYRTVLNQYCVTCHNEKLMTAGLMLDQMNVDRVSDAAPVWEKVVRKLRTGAMPPAGVPRPDQATYDSFATYLESALDRAAIAAPNPGRPAVHRLNRAEYTNAVRDLLGVETDSQALLPADDSGEGFDNIADVLSTSPTLMERYMSAARKISRLAVGDNDARATVETYSVPKLLNQDDRVSEDLLFGTRGGIAVRHTFPLNGEYTIKIRLERANGDDDGYFMGAGEPQQLEVRLDGVRLKSFTVGGEHKGRSTSVSAFGDDAQQAYDYSADDALETRFSAKAGTHLVQVAFVKETYIPEGAFVPPLTTLDSKDWKKRYYEEFNAAVDSIGIGGPYNGKGTGETASRQKVFWCRPGGKQTEEGCARKILTSLAHRAYRRPLADTDLQHLLALYRSGRKDGDFEAGIRVALQGMLVSPKFLFRVEQDPSGIKPGSAYPVNDLELASRLSFFLWSSIPDDELLSLAEHNKLKDREVLEHQVRRMLADPRSQSLVSNFAGQWLLLRSLPKLLPDPDEFPDFDDNLRQAFEKETELFFESNLREDRSVLELLTANYTFVNERLARHYGIPNVYGSQFRRVTLNDEERHGLLGQASLLTVTSYATRTSVVLRGKWLLENVLGTPPPPPPANVPSLKDRGADGKILSVRQQMEQHRANAVCATCHSRMDPLGFALENFNAIGQWRTTEGPAKTPIDSSGMLPDGTKFQGPAELRKILLKQPAQFVTTVTEKMLTYALGRSIEYYDAPTVRKIVRDAASNDYKWSSIILGIVKSVPFQMRKSRES